MQKETKNLFRQIKEIINRVKGVDGTIEVDTEQGLDRIQQISKLTFDYKSSVRKIIQKHEKAYYSIRSKRLIKEEFAREDLQEVFLETLAKTSEKLNASDKSQEL